MLHIILTTKNKSIYVKSLHNLLNIESLCSQVGLPVDITFVNDDTTEKGDALKKALKNSERVMWFEYGSCIDRESLHKIARKYETVDGVVFPTVQEGIDWDMFTSKCKNGSKEPASQMGLTFDTDISSRVIDKEHGFHEVTGVHSPSCWMIDSKKALRKLKEKKKGAESIPGTVDAFLTKCIERNVRLGASIDSRTFRHFTHECPGNIMNMAGVTMS